MRATSVSRDPYPPGSLTMMFMDGTIPVSAWRDLWNYKEELRTAAEKVVRFQSTDEYAVAIEELDELLHGELA